MNKKQIKMELEKLYAKHLKSMNAEELWDITREILYFKIALGLMKKYSKKNLDELSSHGLQHDGAITFKFGDVYQFGVLLTEENDEDIDQLIKDFISELSPHLNKAEQMLFKVALCEELFNLDDIE